MRKFIVICTFLLTFAFVTACAKHENRPRADYGMMALQTYYQNFEEITIDSDLIVEVELTGNTKQFNYGHADWSVADAEVKKVYKGDEKFKSELIQILEVAPLDNTSENYVNKKHLLFLKKYIGPMIEDAYVIAGVYQGNFKIDNEDKLIYEADKYHGYISFQSKLNNQKISVAKERIDVALKQTKLVNDSKPAK
ncbi:hypothetical protein [Cohnella yongneupensis]|uniref:Lipoprotein n=1 Tax=Cohnella yongneupensis TaxID=425006 RepID=A0ABW0QV10_9BACL